MKLFSIILLAIVFVVSGCGQTKTDVESDFSGVTLNVVTSFDQSDGNRDTYMAAVEQFEKDTGVIVNDNSSKSGEAWKKSVITSFQSGDMPDVLFFFTNVPEVTNNSVSLEVIRNTYPTYAETINAAVLNNMREKDGNIYAIPATGFWEGMFINKSLFESNGIAIPETYDMLLTAIEKFKEISIIPIAASIAQEPHYLFEFLLYNKNGPTRHKQLPDTDESFAKWEEGLNDFNLLYQAGAFPDNIDITHEQALELFQQKKAAMFVDGSWRVGAIEDKDDVAVISFPGTSARKTTDLLGGFSMGFHITKAGWDDKQAASVAFVEAVTSKEIIARFNANGSASPIASIETEGDSNLIESIIEMNKSATAFVPALQDSFNVTAREELFKDIRSIALGELTAAQAIERFMLLNH